MKILNYLIFKSNMKNEFKRNGCVLSQGKAIDEL